MNEATAAPLLPIITDSEPCSCAECKSMCRRPCWPIPADVRALMADGEGGKLMLDHWVGDFSDNYERERTYIVCPANPGHEKSSAPELPSFSAFLGLGGALQSGCVFRDGEMCSLHERGLKPTEGRAAHHSHSQPDLHESVARYWDTEEGRATVADWCAP